MPTLPKPKLLLPALVLAALLALPGAPGATLAYVKNPFNATVYVADDDGSGAHKVEEGHNPASPRTGSRSPTCTKARRTRRN